MPEPTVNERIQVEWCGEGPPNPDMRVYRVAMDGKPYSWWHDEATAERAARNLRSLVEFEVRQAVEACAALIERVRCRTWSPQEAANQIRQHLKDGRLFPVAGGVDDPR